MIDDDSHRRLFDAENQVAANARAGAAADARDRLREDSLRLEKEAAISCAIASELLTKLVDAAPDSAHRASASMLSRYEGYQDNQGFPNLRELLSKLARAV